MINLITRKGQKLQLTGDILSGDTFAIKSFVKDYLDGKWVADQKAWRINTGKMESILSRSNSIGLRIDADASAEMQPAFGSPEHFRRSADDPNSDY